MEQAHTLGDLPTEVKKRVPSPHQRTHTHTRGDEGRLRSGLAASHSELWRNKTKKLTKRKCDGRKAAISTSGTSSRKKKKAQFKISPKSTIFSFSFFLFENCYTNFSEKKSRNK